MRAHRRADARRRLPAPAAPRLIDPKRAQAFGAGNPVKRRHHLPHRGRRERHDGQLHPEQLHGLRLGRRRSRARASSMQNRGHGFSLDAGSPNLRRARQAAVPHHHPGVPDQGRPAGDELRRDGRQHAAAGPPADAGAHARPPPAAAGRLRCAALALQPGPRDQRRGGDGRRHRARPRRARPPRRRDQRQLPGFRRRPVHLAPRRPGGRRLRRGQRPAARRPGGGF